MSDKPQPWNPPPGAREWFAVVVEEFIRGSTAEIERTPIADRQRWSNQSIYVPMFVGTLSSRFALSSELSAALLAVLRDRTPAEWTELLARAERDRAAALDDQARDAAQQLTTILDDEARTDEPDSERTRRADYEQEQAKDRRDRGEELGS